MVEEEKIGWGFFNVPLSEGMEVEASGDGWSAGGEIRFGFARGKSVDATIEPATHPFGSVSGCVE